MGPQILHFHSHHHWAGGRVVGSQVIKILLVILKELVCAWGARGRAWTQRNLVVCVYVHIILRTDYMCHTYRDTHCSKPEGGSLGTLSLQSSSVLSTIGGNGGCSSIFPYLGSQTPAQAWVVGGEGLCARQDSSPPAPGRVPSLSVGRHAGANDTAISPATPARISWCVIKNTIGSKIPRAGEGRPLHDWLHPAITVP